MEEIKKLVSMLMDVDAEFSLEKIYNGYRVTVFKDGIEIDDAVWHSHSHGYEKGLLESFILSDCVGYETAQEVFDGWEEMFLELED